MSNFILWNNSVNLKGAEGTFVRAVGPYQSSYWLQRFGYTSKVLDFTSMMLTEDLVKCTEKFIDDTTKAIVVFSTFPFFWPAINPYEPKWVVKAREILESKYPNIKWILTGTGVGRVTKFKLNWHKILVNTEDNLVSFLDQNFNSGRKKFHISKYHGFIPEENHVISSEVLLTELARGCQYTCKFCAYPDLGKKKNTYLRDFAHVKDEFIWNYEKFGVTRYAFCDSTFNESEEKLEELAKIVSDLPFKLEYIAYTRLDLIGTKPGQAELLRDTGMKSTFFGIESFHPEATRAVGKTWNSVHGKEWLLKLKNDIWKDDVNFHLSFIMGLPGEKRADIDETVKWCQTNKMPSFDMRALELDVSLHPKFMSVFEREYNKYGYQFPYPDHPTHWVNDIWHYQAVKRVRNNLIDDINSNNVMTMWKLSTFAGLGYTFDELLWQKQRDYTNELYYEKANVLLNNYIKKVLEDE